MTLLNFNTVEVSELIKFRKLFKDVSEKQLLDVRSKCLIDEYGEDNPIFNRSLKE